jgi:hypothetical protein
MPIIRLLFAGFVALLALVAVAFTAIVVLFTGLMGWVAQWFRGKPPAPRAAPSPNRRATAPMRSDDVIDVVATDVPNDRSVR